MNNPWIRAKKQLKKISRLIEIDLELIKALNSHENVIEVDVEVMLDNGKIKTFKGYRAQHNNIRGPFKGGLRYHHELTAEEVKALSFWMTIKNSIVDVPFGGGKGGIAVNIKELSRDEIKRLTEAFAKELSPFIGPLIDIPAPDVNTTPEIMSWFADTYALEKGKYEAAVVTGKPLGKGGSQGRTEATGLGGIYVLLEILKRLKKDPKEITVAVQGFGNVGYYAAYYLHQAGCKIVAISDSKTGIFREKGINPEKVMEVKNKKLGIEEAYEKETCKTITNSELLELDVDVLIPAALENVITEKNADNIEADIILELANGPSTLEADLILANRGKIVVPDVLANSGGVAVSYFEWLQNIENKNWSKEEVFEKLKKKMIQATDDVFEIHEKQSVSLRDAAYILALKRIQVEFKKRMLKDTTNLE